jgi:hypothetical protein
MKKIIFFISLIYFASNISFSQSLIGTYQFPYYTPYNTFWGVTVKNDTLWIGSGYSNTSTYPFALLYKVSKTGMILDSISTPFKFNHGLAWDGTGFWVAQDYMSAGAKIYKMNNAGVKVDSIVTGSYAGGIGGIALDGNNMWFAVYYPDFTSYPFAYAYKMNLTSKTIVDTIPLRGKQVQGIAVKGDTILYVTDNFQGDVERIYAYRKVIGDTLFSFPVPDSDGDCDPRGLHWDGQYLWLIANRPGNNVNAFRDLYKYALNGQGTPVINTSMNTIEFGNVIIGTTGNQSLNISNLGTAKLIISGKNITSPRFGITPNNVPDTINPGGNKVYNISFTPTAFDTLSAYLQIASNDMATPVKNVLLRGKGVFNGSNIIVSDSAYDYGARRNNSLCGKLIDITNGGSNPLVITNFAFNNTAYRLDTVGLTFPITIDTQRTKTIRVWFHPTGASSYPCNMTITSNAVNAPSKIVSFTGSTNTTPTVIGEVYWQANIPDNPYTTADDVQPVSIKQIGDVNNDGVNDVIISTANYYTICFNGNSSVFADILWLFNTGYDNNNTGSVPWEDAMQVRSDVDGDGIQDVVFGCAGGNEMVYTVSGRTGRQIWAWGDSISYSDGDIEAIRCDRDYNGDGVKDVLVSASGTGANPPGRHAIVCLNGLTGAQIFFTTLNCEFLGDNTTTSFGGVVGLGSNSGAYSVSGFDNSGTPTWSYGTGGKLWSIKEIPSIGTDTVKEVIGNFGFAGTVFCLAENNGAVNWTMSLGSTNNSKIQLLDDLDSNGYIDFTLYGPQVAYRIDSKTHNILWQNSLGSSYLRGVDFLSDVNGDGIRDIVVSTQQPGQVKVLNGATGISMFTHLWGPSLAQRGDRCAVLNSIDGNSTSEFIGGCRDGKIICFSGGPNTPIGIQNISGIVPEKFSLGQNFPNPFNPSTKIKFDIPKVNNTSQSINVSLKVYDVTGREIMTLVNERLQTGSYEYNFEASTLSSGIYFYKLTAGDFSSVKKMVLVR